MRFCVRACVCARARLPSRRCLVFCTDRFVTTSTGRDIRAFVVGGQLIGAYMRINKGSFKSNIHQGGVGKLIRVDPELETLVLKTAELCGLHIAGVDVMMDSDDGTYKICEVRSPPPLRRHCHCWTFVVCGLLLLQLIVALRALRALRACVCACVWVCGGVCGGVGGACVWVGVDVLTGLLVAMPVQQQPRIRRH